MLYMRTYTFSFFFLVSELIRLIKNGLWCDALFFIIFFLFSPACSPQCCNCYHRNFSFYFYKRFFQEETRRKKNYKSEMHSEDQKNIKSASCNSCNPLVKCSCQRHKTW